MADWLYGLGESVRLATGAAASVRRRIESMNRAGRVSRIYTLRVGDDIGRPLSMEMSEADLVEAVTTPPPWMSHAS